MADSAQTWKRIKAFEGGSQTNPKDPGNYCRACARCASRLIGTAATGITPNVFKEYMRRCPVDLAELSQWAAVNGHNVFQWKYWNAIGGDQLRSQGIADSLADFAYNAGTGAPRLFLLPLGLWDDKAQSLPRTEVKGRPITAKINMENEAGFLDRLTTARRAWHMAARNEKGEWLWPHFWQGWERRIAAFSRPGIYPETSENLLRQWRVRWYNNPNGPVDHPPRPPADAGAIVSAAAWLAVPALAIFYGPRLWRMVRRGFT